MGGGLSVADLEKDLLSRILARKRRKNDLRDKRGRTYVSRERSSTSFRDAVEDIPTIENPPRISRTSTLGRGATAILVRKWEKVRGWGAGHLTLSKIHRLTGEGNDSAPKLIKPKNRASYSHESQECR